MALGFPVAVTIGWQLATPATRSAAIDTPGGAGGMGNAPARHVKPAPATTSSSAASPTATVTPSASPSTPVSTPVGHPVATAVTKTPAGPPTTAATEVTEDPLPPLNLPPVPTPTEPDYPDSAGTISLTPWPTDSVFSERRFHWRGPGRR